MKKRVVISFNAMTEEKETVLIISNHAKKRIKQRIHKNYQKVTEDAWVCGVKHSQLKGKFKKFMDGICFRSQMKGNLITRYIVFYGNVFLFSKNVLVTVLPIPGRMQSIAQRLTKENCLRKNVEKRIKDD